MLKPFYQEDGVTIYNGDSPLIMGHLRDESIDMIWTDLPYGHANNDNDLQSLRKNKGGIHSRKIANDTPAAFRCVFNAALVQAVRVLKKDSCCCCCCCGGGGPNPTFAFVADRMDSFGMQFYHTVIWDKMNIGLGWKYRRQYEMLMIAHRSGGKIAWNPDAKAVSNIYKKSLPKKKHHPNEKPVEMPAYFIGLHTRPGDLVLDPFMGSGTTLLAARALGRRVIGIELDQSYCETAVERLRQSDGLCR